MERQNLYKSRSKGTDAARSREQNRNQQNRARTNRRQQSHTANRNLDVTCSPPSPPLIRAQPQRAPAQPQTIQQKISRLRELRNADAGGAKKRKERSPFISVVPVGRIVPPKRDVVEDHMRKFREAREVAAATVKRRVSGGVTKKRINGKTPARKTPASNRAVIAKPVSRPKGILKSSLKKSGSKRKSGEAAKKKMMVSIMEPEPEPEIEEAEMEEPAEVDEVEGQPKTNNSGYFVFVEPENFAPKAKSTVFKAKEPSLQGPTPFKFSQGDPEEQDGERVSQKFTFLTSTATKKNSPLTLAPVPCQPIGNDTFFDGISPLQETLLEPEPKTPEDELNTTFPTDEDQGVEETPKLPVDLKEQLGTTVRRSILKNGEKFEVSLTLPVIDEKLDQLDSSMKEETEKEASVKEETEEEASLKEESEKEASLKEESEKEEVEKEASFKVETEEVAPVNARKSRSISKRKSRSGSDSIHETSTVRKSHRTSLEDQPQSSLHVQDEAAKHHHGVLNSEIARMNDLIATWTSYKAENECSPETHGMIDTAIGQTELLLKKKFMKFRDLIKLFEEGHQSVRSDDLDGYWAMVGIEVEDINRRFTELEAWRDNQWEDPVVKSDRKKAVTKKGKKNKAEASSKLKSLIGKMRANRNKVAPSVDDEAFVPLVETPGSRSKRLQDTPRSQPKRRSTNCSGCTPRKSGKKSLLVESLKKETKGTPVEAPKSGRKSARKSVRQMAFQEDTENQTPNVAEKSVSKKKTMNELLPPEASSILKSTAKSAGKRSSRKTVIFAVVETPDTTTLDRKSRRIAKTPRPSKAADEEDMEEDSGAFSLPADTSKVTIGRGSSHSRRTASSKTVVEMSDSGESPFPETDGIRTRRSKKLF